MNNQHPLSVGIYSEPTVCFCLHTPYTFEGQTFEGEQTASVRNGKVLFCGNEYDEIIFRGGGRFTLQGVTIGVHFHWERKEDQTFAGDLRLIVEDGKVTAINLLGVEDYLTSVISSEMSATSHIELLKAHAVISRSWVLRPILNPSGLPAQPSHKAQPTDTEHITWYERDAHTHFDVCADDHCQRYQGITRQTSDNVRKAIEATWGEVLTYGGKICDARFYKSCGGATELFDNCWADETHPYLQAVRDAGAGTPLPDLTDEAQAEQWIRTAPDAFCNTSDKRILSQVLNNYDQETTDFYRWRVQYTQQELSELVRERSGIDFGTVLDLRPVRRGPSARLVELEIIGTKHRMVIGKELEIRKWLSHSHLYSSAFVVDRNDNQDFILIGAGWGHGVGLCQIGAAVMAERGYTYQQILAHYFPGASLQRM